MFPPHVVFSSSSSFILDLCGLQSVLVWEEAEFKKQLFFFFLSGISPVILSYLAFHPWEWVTDSSNGLSPTKKMWQRGYADMREPGKANPRRIKCLSVISVWYPCRLVITGTVTNQISCTAGQVFIPWNQLGLVSVRRCFSRKQCLTEALESICPYPILTVWPLKKKNVVYTEIVSECFPFNNNFLKKKPFLSCWVLKTCCP